MRYTVDGQIKRANGIKGAAGVALIAGLIDGLIQALSDIGQCFSKAERIYRIAIATGLGLLAGVAASAVFVATAFAAPFGLIPVLASIAVGLSLSAYFQKEGGLKIHYLLHSLNKSWKRIQG